MTLKTITHSDDADFITLKGLYQSAFPDNEKREIKSLIELLQNPKFEFIATHYQDKLAGFITVWNLKTCRFIEHFAIMENFRNQGIGAKVLSRIVGQSSTVSVLECEPPRGIISQKRLAFYQREGFDIISKDYYQPPYRQGDSHTLLYLMASQKVDKVGELTQEIYSVVYGV